MADIRFITVNGARLGFQVHAEGSGRPPAVFLPGYSGRATGGDAYAPLLAALAEVFTLYALDPRGHGASVEAVDGFSMAALADDLAAFVRELDLGRAVLIGHSLGGFIGMDAELRHPRTFAALCLLASASAEGGTHTPPENAAMLIEHGQDRDFMRDALASMYVRGSVDESHVAAAALLDPDIHRTYFAEYPDRIIIDQLHRLTLPVLMLNGALDIVVPLATQHATALALPHAKEVVATTEGHMLPIEAPLFTAREIIAFWRHDVGELLPRVAAEPSE